MATGKFTGLQYRPLQGDISNDILAAEDQAFKKRAEDRLIEDRKTQAKAAKEAARKTALGRVKSINLYDTGSDSLNATLAEAVKVAQQEYPKIFEVLDNSDKYSLAEQSQAQLKLNYLNDGGLVNDLKIMTNAVMSEYQGYEKALAGNQIFRDEAFEKKFENGYKGVTISLDDNLRPVTLFKNEGVDSDGDGIIDVETMESLTDAYSRPQFQRNIDYDTAITQHATKLKSYTEQTDNGITSVKTTGVEPNLFNDSVDRFLYDEDGTPAAPMLAFLRQRGLDPNNPEHLDKVESDYKNDLYLRTEREKIKNVDGGTALANRKFNQENQQGKIGNVTTPTAETYSIYQKNIEGDKVNSVTVMDAEAIPSIKITPTNSDGTRKEGKETYFVSNLTPHNVTRDKFGRMIVEGSYQTVKSVSMKEQQYQEELAKAIASKDEEAIYAYQTAQETSGGRNVSLPGKIERKDITISKEDEGLIAEKTGVSLEELDKSIYKEPKNQTIIFD